MQHTKIGWATKDCTYQEEEGVGIGDDVHSFSYDGCRGLLWYNQFCTPHQHPNWQLGMWLYHSTLLFFDPLLANDY